jgi:hypothetical protein
MIIPKNKNTDNFNPTYLIHNQHKTYNLPSLLYNNKKSVINRARIFVNWTESSTFVAK